MNACGADEEMAEQADGVNKTPLAGGKPYGFTGDPEFWVNDVRVFVLHLRSTLLKSSGK